MLHIQISILFVLCCLGLFCGSCQLKACDAGDPVIDTWSPAQLVRPGSTRKFNAMRIETNSSWTAVAGGGQSTGLIVDDSHLCFRGRWNADQGDSKSYWYLLANSDLVLQPDAVIVNNMSNQIYARPFEIFGTDGSQVITCAVGFQADQTGWDPNFDVDNQPAWDNTGLSTLRVNDAIYVTQHSQNLPTIHKKSETGEHTHHGLLVLGDATWVVQTNEQFYDGGVNSVGDWTLQADQPITVSGTYSIAAKIVVGNFGDTGHQITKRGQAAWTIYMSQAYSAGSSLIIEEGLVDMMTDPGDPGALAKSINWPTRDPGQFLQTTIAETGELRLRVESGLLGLRNSGSLQIDAGLDLDAESTLTTSSSVYVSQWSAFPITCAADLHLDGTLTLPAGAPLGSDDIMFSRKYRW